MFLFSCSTAILLFSFLFFYLFFSFYCFSLQFAFLSFSFSFSLFTTHVSLLYLFFPSFISLFCSKNSTCYACMLLQWLSKAMIFRIIHSLFSFHFNLPKFTIFFFFSCLPFLQCPKTQPVDSFFYHPQNKLHNGHQTLYSLTGCKDCSHLRQAFNLTLEICFLLYDCKMTEKMVEAGFLHLKKNWTFYLFLQTEIFYFLYHFQFRVFITSIEKIMLMMMAKISIFT